MGLGCTFETSRVLAAGLVLAAEELRLDPGTGRYAFHEQDGFTFIVIIHKFTDGERSEIGRDNPIHANAVGGGHVRSGESPATGNVAEPRIGTAGSAASIADATLSTSLTRNGKPRERSVMRCRNCGALGFRADGCGTSHQPSTTPATAAHADPSPPPHARGVDRKPSPASSPSMPSLACFPGANKDAAASGLSSARATAPYQPLAPVAGRPLRDLPSSPAAIARRKERIARATAAPRTRSSTPITEERLAPLSVEDLASLPIATFIF